MAGITDSGAGSDRGRLKVRLGPGDLAVEIPEGGSLRVDAEGRWGSFRPAGALHRRTLDGKVLVHAGPELRLLTTADAASVHRAAIAFAADLAARVARDDLVLDLHGFDATESALLDRLGAAGRWTVARYHDEARRFAEAYPEPVFILPPDRYQDVVVLPAVGCPHGRCRFCAFYRERGFRILEPDAFEAHVEAVRRFFGRALPARNGVFLGSASALSIPQAALERVLAVVRREVGEPARGLAAFEDPDHAPRRDAADYGALRSAGLRTITVGLESGLPALRAELGKRPELDRVLAAVATQKRAGLASGVTVLIGAGGRAAARDHLEATTATIGEMPLEASDMVYLSPLAESLSEGELAQEYRRFRARLAEVTRAKIVPYRIERYHYFA